VSIPGQLGDAALGADAIDEVCLAARSGDRWTRVTGDPAAARVRAEYPRCRLPADDCHRNTGEARHVWLNQIRHSSPTDPSGRLSSSRRRRSSGHQHTSGFDRGTVPALTQAGRQDPTRVHSRSSTTRFTSSEAWPPIASTSAPFPSGAGATLPVQCAESGRSRPPTLLAVSE